MYQVRIKPWGEWQQWFSWSSNGNPEGEAIVTLLEAGWKKVTIEDNGAWSSQYRKAK